MPFAQAGDVRLHYEMFGQGVPFVLVSGTGWPGEPWKLYQAPAFAERYQVIVYDHRGVGKSDAPAGYYSTRMFARDAANLLDAIGIKEPAHIMGHSMGGTVSLLYAAKYPGRAKSLIVIDSTVNLSAERIGRLRDIGSRPGKNYETQDELVSRYRLRPGDSLATPDVVQHIARNSSKQAEDGTWRHKFDRAVYATRQVFDGTPLWADVKIPALLVKGDRSERITPEVVAETRKLAPQVELAEVSNTDHHVTLDNPIGFLEAVRPFLAKHR